MADFDIGSVKRGFSGASADAITASQVFISSPAYRQAIATEKGRAEFIRGLTIRQEHALASNQIEHYKLFGAILKDARSYEMGSFEGETTGRRFDSQRLMG